MDPNQPSYAPFKPWVDPQALQDPFSNAIDMALAANDLARAAALCRESLDSRLEITLVSGFRYEVILASLTADGDPWMHFGKAALCLYELCQNVKDSPEPNGTQHEVNYHGLLVLRNILELLRRDLEAHDQRQELTAPLRAEQGERQATQQQPQPISRAALQLYAASCSTATANPNAAAAAATATSANFNQPHLLQTDRPTDLRADSGASMDTGNPTEAGQGWNTWHNRSPLIKTEDSIVMDMPPPSLEQPHLIKPHKRHNTPTNSGYGGSIPHTAIHQDRAIKRGSSPALSDH
ncbi:uncharacterized protein IWZ02DRAFT_489606 [Phyllosticta citriasiana]|uniref:uncharacterized protein n=1 Tax=Phyllosticta citriasiana TaxID=595635 RepID=UPI0030FD4114